MPRGRLFSLAASRSNVCLCMCIAFVSIPSTLYLTNHGRQELLILESQSSSLSYIRDGAVVRVYRKLPSSVWPRPLLFLVLPPQHPGVPVYTVVLSFHHANNFSDQPCRAFKTIEHP